MRFAEGGDVNSEHLPPVDLLVRFAEGEDVSIYQLWIVRSVFTWCGAGEVI